MTVCRERAGGAWAAAGEAKSPRRQGRERTRLPRPARLAELPAPRADRKSRPRGSGRGLIRVLFAMQQPGGGLSLADLAQWPLKVRSRRREGRGKPRTRRLSPLPGCAGPSPGVFPSGRPLPSLVSSPGWRLPFLRPPAALRGAPSPQRELSASQGVGNRFQTSGQTDRVEKKRSRRDPGERKGEGRSVRRGGELHPPTVVSYHLPLLQEHPRQEPKSG